MMISRLILKNWKNFISVDVTLGPRVFLVGANASGKSNLMNALLFLQGIAGMRGGLQEAIQDRGGLSHIRSLSAKKNAVVEIQIFLSDEQGQRPRWIYSLGIEENENSRSPRLIYERVWDGEKQILSRPDEEDAKYPERLEQTYLESKTSHQQFREVAAFVQSLQYHSFVPQLLQKPTTFRGPETQDDDATTLLLLEEPEISLPGSVVRRLAAEIHSVQSRRKQMRQVIISTHSFDLLSDLGIGGEEVLVLEPGPEGTTVRPASSIPETRDLLEAGFSAGEAVLPRVERTLAQWKL
jgi:predicted ATPase